MFSRQHYRLVVKLLKKNRRRDGFTGEFYFDEQLMYDLMDYFKSDNPLFNEEIFIEAMEQDEEEGS